MFWYWVFMCVCVCVCVVFQWRRSSRWPGCSSRSRGSCWWPCPGWTSWATSWRRWGATGWSILSLLLITTATPPRLSWSASTKSCRWDDPPAWYHLNWPDVYCVKWSWNQTVIRFLWFSKTFTDPRWAMWLLDQQNENVELERVERVVKYLAGDWMNHQVNSRSSSSW